jgi:hypothetical protein
MRDSHFLLGARHWLVEPAGTNSALFSRDLTNAAWTKLGATPTTIGGSTTGPDATTITKNGIIGGNGAFADQGIVNAAAYVWTDNTVQAQAYKLKPGNKSWWFIESVDKAGVVATSWFNSTTGAKGTTAGTHTLGVVGISAGFYSLEAQLSTSGVGALGKTWRVCPCDADNSKTLTGDGVTVNGYCDMIQHEQDYFWPSSFIFTTNVAATRATDGTPLHATSAPQSRTLYVSTTEIGLQYLPGTGSIAGVGLGSSAAGDTYQGFGCANGTMYRVQQANNFSAKQSLQIVGPGIGHQFEIRTATNNPVNLLTGGSAVDGGIETAITPVVITQGFTAQYQPTNNYFIGGPLAIRKIVDVLGVHTLTECRLA